MVFIGLIYMKTLKIGDMKMKIKETKYRDIGLSKAKQFVCYCIGVSIIIISIAIFYVVIING